MQQLKFVISLLLLCCYLCPFQSCGWKGATTQVATVDSATVALVTKPLVAADSAAPLADTPSGEEALPKRLFRRIVFPTDDSISGVGIMLSADSFAPAYALIASFMLSLFTLIAFRRWQAARRPWLAPTLNVITLAIYAVSSSIGQGSSPPLWGYWLLMALLAAQLGLALKNKASLDTHRPIRSAGQNTTTS